MKNYRGKSVTNMEELTTFIDKGAVNGPLESRLITKSSGSLLRAIFGKRLFGIPLKNALELCKDEAVEIAHKNNYDIICLISIGYTPVELDWASMHYEFYRFGNPQSTIKNNYN